MKERIFIGGAFILLILLLIGLNAASYVQKEKIPDSEMIPNRSTYNTGPTGTRALHDLLVSTGHDVVRWEQPTIELSNPTDSPAVFVIVGKTRREITDEEIDQIMEWVDLGGRLVLISRELPIDLLTTTGPWKIELTERSEAFTAGEKELLLPTVDPSNVKQMTDGIEAVGPLQPTALSKGVNAIQPSKFAAAIAIRRIATAPPTKRIQTSQAPAGEDLYDDRDFGLGSGAPAQEPDRNTDPDVITDGLPDPNSNTIQSPESIAVRTKPNSNEESFKIGVNDEPVPVDKQATEKSEDPEDDIDYTMLAPVVHFGSDKSSFVVDFPYGYGAITVLSDPYIVSNGGIKLVDNAQIAVNMVSYEGKIAFDEFHQGYGSDQNRLLSYFTGTPLIPLFWQLCLILGLIVYSRGKRFARPLPVREPSRISKLEYIAAMAQLKQRTGAYDLAVENIYTDFRRRVSRVTGVANTPDQNVEMADAIALRTEYNAADVFRLMQKCEDIMHGGPTTKKEVLSVTTRLREIENALGLRRGRATFLK